MTISSMGGIEPDESAAPAAFARMSRGRTALVIIQSVARVAIGFLFIVLVMSIVPDKPDHRIVFPVITVIGGTVLYVLYFRRQLRGVYKARYPTLRAVEALILVAAMFLAIFAMLYVMISATDGNSFTEPLDSFNAYYYSLTVLATVGFGDIAPNTVMARSVTMVQMALDIAFIAVVIRVMATAAKRALMARQEAEQAAAPPQAPAD